MLTGGQLTLTTANAHFDNTHTTLRPEAYAGPAVMLEVRDTGCGMSADIQASMFDPFFTTKEIGKGSGLGLSTVYGIVKDSGGHIVVRSEPAVGSTFRVYLPQLAERVRPGPPVVADDPMVTPLPRGETILIVEDEDGVRRLARLVLEKHRYTVLDASNCREALLCAEQHQGPIDLLVTDLVMPDGSGTLVAALLSEQRNEMKVLYMSGHTDNALLNRRILDHAAAFLQKPFTMQALARKVREVIDASDRGTSS